MNESPRCTSLLSLILLLNCTSFQHYLSISYKSFRAWLESHCLPVPDVLPKLCAYAAPVELATSDLAVWLFVLTSSCLSHLTLMVYHRVGQAKTMSIFPLIQCVI